MKDSINSKRGRFILIFLAIVLIGGIWFMFLRTSGDPIDGLDGKWLRTDGDYTIEISDVAEDGKMTAKYFNPTPINVGRSAWRINEDRLQIYVELQDENYPGSLYQLYYDAENEKLIGSYYQAVSRQTFNVEFNKK